MIRGAHEDFQRTLVLGVVVDAQDNSPASSPSCSRSARDRDHAWRDGHFPRNVQCWDAGTGCMDCVMGLMLLDADSIGMEMINQEVV